MESPDAEDERSLRIAEELQDETHECPSCLERVRVQQPIWSCNECFHVYHFACIRRWAQVERDMVVFSCPQCRHVQSKPLTDHCFCGKVSQPKYDPLSTPHSCGRPCGRARPHCSHRCPAQCHPGPCPRCHLIVGPKPCPCGATTYTYPCGQPDPETTCGNVCGRPLACGTHRCPLRCHIGPCPPCRKLTELLCYCGKTTQEHPCTTETSFGCGSVCGKMLRCGKHACTQRCHAGECPPCPMDPASVRTCPCGSSELTAVRYACTDPIPQCGRVCNKLLECGQHRCQLTCHAGACPACEVRLDVSCRCRKVRKRLPCAEAQNFTCAYECGTKLSCGRHKCKVICCADRNKTQADSHLCFQVCGRPLPCGHTCEDLCHTSAQCPSCVHVVTERLTCCCGAEVLRPPQPCGTKPPVCKRACRVPRPCGHPSGHTCHFGPCPPCPTLVQRECPRHHTQVSLPCGVVDVACEEECGAELPCGHYCDRVCHSGPCVDEANPCRQRCDRVHDECEHHCAKTCHGSTPCPPCSVYLRCTCNCGRVTRSLPCSKVGKRKADGPNKFSVVVPCDDECLFTRRLDAIASLSKTKNEKYLYSLALWDAAQQDARAVQRVERQLLDFVEGRESAASLPPANAAARALTHSLATYFHVLCESVDREPQRSCLLTKTGTTSAPPVLLSDAVRDTSMDPLQFLTRCVKPSHKEKMCLVVSGGNVTESMLATYLADLSGRFVVAPPEVNGDGVQTLLIAFTTHKRASEAIKKLEAINSQRTFTVARATA
ncbi:transcription factor-like protein [Novymonas esmeraldas]|uniref:Transcription factor-like protein n=1 Tax=Novymonas esmeraldas TaxID=1808958 RepID=A0AAW0ETZ5_9TRYP